MCVHVCVCRCERRATSEPATEREGGVGERGRGGVGERERESKRSGKSRGGEKRDIPALRDDRRTRPAQSIVRK
jgi:hypothetical protein